MTKCPVFFCRAPPEQVVEMTADKASEQILLSHAQSWVEQLKVWLNCKVLFRLSRNNRYLFLVRQSFRVTTPQSAHIFERHCREIPLVAAISGDVTHCLLLKHGWKYQQ